MGKEKSKEQKEKIIIFVNKISSYKHIILFEKKNIFSYKHFILFLSKKRMEVDNKKLLNKAKALKNIKYDEPYYCEVCKKEIKDLSSMRWAMRGTGFMSFDGEVNRELKTVYITCSQECYDKE